MQAKIRTRVKSYKGRRADDTIGVVMGEVGGLESFANPYTRTRLTGKEWKIVVATDGNALEQRSALAPRITGAHTHAGRVPIGPAARHAPSDGPTSTCVC